MHYCSQRRGTPAIPLAEYGPADLEREYGTEKPCAPLCTVSCVHRTAWLDQLRENPRQALGEFFPSRDGGDPTSADFPLPVRLLTGLFLPEGPNKSPKLATRLAVKILGLSGEKHKSIPAQPAPKVNDSLEGTPLDE